ncbi:MAG: hypothetical protein VYE68_12020 [Acidobacteriota bacterium]|nr:hypothetical protein [Acidobacteriota bacterium]
MTGGRWVQRVVLRVLGMASRAEVAATRARVDTVRQQLRAIEGEIRATRGQLDKMAKAIRETQMHVGSRNRGLEGTLSHVDRNVNALIRRQYLDQQSLPFPHDILSQRFHLWSQNEEDGITLALFKTVGTVHHRFVELGAGVNGGNSGFLADVCGWSGLMVDAAEARVAKLAVRFGRFGVKTVAEWVTRETVNTLLTSHAVPEEVDLVSIDIDGNDYWVWQALRATSPRVVIVEFNPFFGRSRSVVVRYDPRFDRRRFKSVTPFFYGASLGALARLGTELGYRLVLVEPRGINAYFLRNDVEPSRPAWTPEVLHPKPVAEPAHLFELIEREQLPLIDLERDTAV